MRLVRNGPARLRTDHPLRNVAAIVIVGFWLFQFAVLSGMRLLDGTQDARGFLLARMLVTCAGAVLSAIILKIHERQPGKRLPLRALTAFGLALIASAIHAAVNFLVFQLFFGAENAARATLQSYLSSITFWFWCYFAMSSLLLALVYSRELSEREHEFAELERLTQAAQLKALRYQLNPHFMFNTLNSIAALICTGENGVAEQMTEGLAEFLRATLAIDPYEDHSLEEEIRLQLLYLEIEKLRFPDRLFFSVTIADGAALARVPSLILQPLTENAVKHCVALSSKRSDLTIESRIREGRLTILVTTSPARTAARGSPRSTGIGLRNVAARLDARFGDRQSFWFGKLPDGSFQVRLEIPLTLGDS